MDEIVMAIAKHGESIGVIGVLMIVAVVLYKRNEKLEEANERYKDETYRRIDDFKHKFEKTDEKVDNIKNDVREVKNILRYGRDSAGSILSVPRYKGKNDDEGEI